MTTEGDNVHGVYADRTGGGGDIVIIVEDSTVTTSGPGAHGIYAYRDGGDGAIDIVIRNAVVRATGDGSHGIQVRGGGRVIIGPHGRVGATSGAAIRVTRADTSNANEEPRLNLDLILNGRRVEKVLAGRVENESGPTALTVNNVPLFDSEAGGATNMWVPNGAWDVRATGNSLSTLAFTQEFAPRAAVYEALPGVLLRLDEGGGPGGGGYRLRSPDTPAWARIAGGWGSYRADSSTAGARYSHDRFSVESGMDLPLDHMLTGLGLSSRGLTGWAGVRLVSGSAKVSAPTGGGRIEARGYGLAGGLAWEGEDDWYGSGRLSLTRYTADLFSSARGGLKGGVTGLVHGFGLEGGRRFDLDLGVKTRLTVRGMLRGSGVSLSGFDDGLFSRVSIEETDRLAAGAGVAVETGLLRSGGVDRLVLRGSLDAEQALSAGSKVDVSGTALESKAGGTGFGVGFSGTYRMDGYTIGGAVGASGLGSGDTAFSGRLETRIAF